jgi:hypothetical protein
MKDSNTLIDYDYKPALDLPKEVLDRFINNFNQNIKNLISSTGFSLNDIKIITGHEQFFKFWKGKFVESGLKLRKKTLKMVGSINSIDK